MNTNNFRLSILVATIAFFNFSAQADQASVSRSEAMSAALELMADLDMQAELTWKVGDISEYKVSASMGGNGTMVKTVTKDEGTAIWVHSDMKTSGRNDLIDKLYDKATGNVLKVIRNGAEQNPEDSKVQVISQTEETIKVPAGTYKVNHIVGKTAKSPKIEMWVNTADTAIDGVVKMIMKTTMVTITSEMTKFKKVTN